MSDVHDLERLAYRIPEAAQVVGISERTMQRRVCDGTIRSQLVGGVRLIPRDALLTALNEQTTEPEVA